MSLRPLTLVNYQYAVRLLVVQVVVLSVMVLFLLSTSLLNAKSIFLGGGVAIVASSYFSWQSFRYKGAQASNKIVRGFKLGLTGKFILNVVGLVLVCKSVYPINTSVVFLGFLAVQLISLCFLFWHEGFRSKQ